MFQPQLAISSDTGDPFTHACTHIDGKLSTDLIDRIDNLDHLA